MKKSAKMILIISIVLNVGMGAGFIFYKALVKKQGKHLAVITAQAEERQLTYILSKLETDDQQKISLLKEELRKKVENVRKSIDIWENM